MTTRFRLVLSGLVMLLGCADQRPATGAGSSVSDSAGVAIVVSTTPEWGGEAEWRLRAEPELVIGDERTVPSVLLVGVNGARRLADGSFAVALNGDKVVRWFDRRGREWGEPATSGDGDTPFASVELVGMLGDSVLVWDGQRGVATVLLPGRAEPARHFRLAGDSGASRYGLALAGAFSDGRLLLVGRSGTESRMEGGARRDTIPVGVGDRDGNLVHLIAVVPSHESVVATGPGFVTILALPFGARTTVAIDDTDALVSVGDRDEVLRLSADEGLVAIHRLDRPRRVISVSELTAQRERLGQQVAQLPANVGEAVVDAFRNAGMPTIYPAHDRVVVDARGATWLREDIGPQRGDKEARRWTVLDRDGRWLGFVTTPARLQVQQITRDRVIGVWRDENDVEHLQVYRLDR